MIKNQNVKFFNLKFFKMNSNYKFNFWFNYRSIKYQSNEVLSSWLSNLHHLRLYRFNSFLEENSIEFSLGPLVESDP